MLSDASAARDLARSDLSRAEQETVAARSAREQEKKRLQTLADERRRHYEAMEKRLRLASVGEDKEDSGEGRRVPWWLPIFEVNGGVVTLQGSRCPRT